MKKNNPVRRFFSNLFGHHTPAKVKAKGKLPAKLTAVQKQKKLRKLKRRMRAGLDLKYVNGQQRVAARYFRTLRRNARRKVERDPFTGKLA